MKRSFFVLSLLMAAWALLPQASRAQDLLVTTTNISGYTNSGGVLTIQSAGTYSIAMASGVTTTTNHIVVSASSGTANITLSGVNINTSASSGTAAFNITGNANVIVTLADGTTNVLSSGAKCAGLQKSNGTSYNLTLTGNGSLTATGGSRSAGIGGAYGADGSNITISGGNITANGGDGDGVGIGGGAGFDGVSITVSGGTVTANGNGGSAGIGGGSLGSCSGIVISGGTVIANGGSSGGAGIGSGQARESGDITLTGGTITATGGGSAAGIGSGVDGLCSSVIITGGSIKALGGSGSTAQNVGCGTNTNGVNYTPVDATSTQVEAFVVTLTGKANLAVTGTTGLSSYGISGVKTNGSGILYLWLPRSYENTTIGITLSDGSTTSVLLPARGAHDLLVETIDGSYTYSGTILNISGAGTYTLAMNGGVTSTSNKILVSGSSAAAGSTINIILNGVSVVAGTTSSIDSVCALKITGPVNVNIILATGSVNVLQSGFMCAGLQKSNSAAYNLTITGAGSLTATGGMASSGIGAKYGETVSNLSITGGSIKAVGGTNIPGMGNGSTSYTPTNGAANGSSNLACYTYTFTGMANRTITNIEGVPSYYLANGVVADENGKIYLWLPATGQPIIYADANGTTYTNGTTESDGSVTMTAYTSDILVTTSVANSFTYNNGIVDITKAGDYTIKMKSGVTTSSNRIVVSGSAAVAGDNINITLSGISLNTSASAGAAAFNITGNVNVKVILADGTANTLVSGSGCAGLQKSNGSSYSLTLEGGGNLTATGGSNGAGVGGGSGTAASNIIITDGSIIATGMNGAQNIGGGAGAATSSPTNGTANGGAALKGYTYNFGQAGSVVTFYTGVPSYFGAQGVLTNGNGKVCLWLPSTSQPVIYASAVSTTYTNGTTENDGSVTMIPYTNDILVTTSVANGFTFDNGIIDITKAGDYTLQLMKGLTSTTHRVVVSGSAAAAGSAVNITLSGVNINTSATAGAAALNVIGNVNVTLITTAGTLNTLASGSGCAGLQKSNGSSYSLTLEGSGSLVATGGSNGAGIGGGSGTAASNIIITDGSIKAAGMNGAQNIGGGAGAATSSPTNGAANGSAALTCYTYNFGPAGSVVTNFTGLPSYYGNNGVTTDADGKICLWLPDATLPVITADCGGENYTNDNTESDGSVTMILTSNTANDIRVTSSVSAGYTYSGGIITITKKGNYSLKMKTGTTSTTNRVVVSGSAASAGDTISITLKGINIDASATTKVAAFDITGAVNVKVILADNTENILKSGSGCAGLQKSNDAAYNLAIGGNGSLAATAGMGGAGIGSKINISSCSNITITGGTVVAKGGVYSAGIGGGFKGAATNITITGGSVNAIAGSSAPQAIGNGYSSGASNYTPTNGSAALTLYTYTFTGLAGTDITHYAGLPTYFGTKGIKTDASGKIYLYLPSGYSLTPQVESSRSLSGGFSTLCYPAPVTLENGVKAYTITGTDANDYIVYTEVTGTLPAHTPVLLGDPSQGTVTLPTVLYDAAQTGLANSLLKGIYTAMSAPVGSYVLQKQDGVIAFYKVATGKQPSVGAFRCYLESGASGINVLRIGDGTLDGIETPVNDNETLGDFTIYDLAGRKVMAPQKGKVYIVNGKKAIFK